MHRATILAVHKRVQPNKEAQRILQSTTPLHASAPTYSHCTAKQLQAEHHRPVRIVALKEAKQWPPREKVEGHGACQVPGASSP